MIKLSKASKMPCKSWSLQAIDTCPGSINPKDGTLVAACAGCYATTGNYNFPNVKKPREHNREDWKRPEFVQEFIDNLKKDSYFRWFDSGDAYDLRLLKKIHQIIQGTPHVKHWLPTRMYKFTKFKGTLSQISKLDNAVVRLSSDSRTGKTIQGSTTSTIYHSEPPKVKHTICSAYEREGKCGDCRECWNKEVKVIAYPAHGKKMIRLVSQSS